MQFIFAGQIQINYLESLQGLLLECLQDLKIKICLQGQNFPEFKAGLKIDKLTRVFENVFYLILILTIVFPGLKM